MSLICEKKETIELLFHSDENFESQNVSRVYAHAIDQDTITATVVLKMNTEVQHFKTKTFEMPNITKKTKLQQFGWYVLNNCVVISIPRREHERQKRENCFLG